MAARNRPDYLLSLKQRNQKIACLTAYDASFACWLAQEGVDAILVGDSLGMVVQGHESTLPVTVDDMVYHAAAVARGAPDLLRIVDLPYHSYQTPEQALDNAHILMQAGRAHMVKLEGGERVLPMVEALRAADIPVCGHLGLLPQSVKELGGYRVQGRDPQAARQIEADAQALQTAGVAAIVLECIPAVLAARITAALEIPTIGIGAGADCDGQVLVLYDMLGITAGRRPSFSEDFLRDAPDVASAIRRYVQAVRQGRFPTQAHSFS